jgi:hypothetical protein
MIANQARDGQGHVQALSGGKSELDVLQTQRHLEPGRFIGFVRDDRAIGVVDRRREKRAGQDFDKAMRVDPRFARESNGLSQTLDGRGNQEIATQLDEIGVGRLFADDEGLLSHRIEQALAFFDRIGGTGGRAGNMAMASGHSDQGRQNRLFAALTPEDRSLLAPHLQDLSIKLGSLLQEAGEPVEHVYFPHQGMISLLAVTGLMTCRIEMAPWERGVAEMQEKCAR